MKRYGARGALSDPPQLGESVVVLAWEAEAAIARLAAASVDQILGADEDLKAALTEAYLQGQREALVAAVQRVEELNHWEEHVREFVHRDEAIAAIKGDQP